MDADIQEWALIIERDSRLGAQAFASELSALRNAGAIVEVRTDDLAADDWIRHTAQRMRRGEIRSPFDSRTASAQVEQWLSSHPPWIEHPTAAQSDTWIYQALALRPAPPFPRSEAEEEIGSSAAAAAILDQSSSSGMLQIEDQLRTAWSTGSQDGTVVHQALSHAAAAACSSSAAADVRDASFLGSLRRRLQGGRSGTPPRLNPVSPTLWPTGVPSPNSVWHGRRPEPSAAAAARVPDPEQMVLTTRTGRRYHNIMGCPRCFGRTSCATRSPGETFPAVPELWRGPVNLVPDSHSYSERGEQNKIDPSTHSVKCNRKSKFVVG